MTIDELRKRKQELSQRKYELEALPQEKRDALALAIVSEELWDVLEQIKALTPSAKAGKVKREAAPGCGFVLDRQQFRNWQVGENSLDEGIPQGHTRLHTQLRKEMLCALDRLPPGQREALKMEIDMDMKLMGCAPKKCAENLGISRKNYYQRYYRAKKSLQAESEKALEITRLLDGRRTLDLTEAGVMKAVLTAITPRQAAYFYLYYSEGMDASKISKLTGVHRVAVSTGTARALRRLDVLLNGRDVILEHPEALDTLGYTAYCELRDRPELAQANSSAPNHCSRWKRQELTPPKRVPYKCTIHVRVFQRKLSPDTPPGKLRAALMEHGEEILPALTAVFAFCQRKFEQGIECLSTGGGQEALDIISQSQDAASMPPATEKEDLTAAINYFMEKQRFFKLPSSRRSSNTKAARAYAKLCEEIAAALKRLSATQREALYLALEGRSPLEIAGIQSSHEFTVKWRINSAEKKVLRDIELVITRKRLLAGGHILDMRNPDVLDTILMVLTPTQAAYFYLYYSENLTHKKIGTLTGHIPAASRNSKADALRVIDFLLGGQDVFLEHPEALDQLGYSVYCGLSDHPELIQEAISWDRPGGGQGREYLMPHSRAVTKEPVHVRVLQQGNPLWTMRGNAPEVPHGWLLAALVKDGKDLLEGLKTVFSVCRYKIEQQRIANDRR